MSTHDPTTPAGMDGAMPAPEPSAAPAAAPASEPDRDETPRAGEASEAKASDADDAIGNVASEPSAASSEPSQAGADGTGPTPPAYAAEDEEQPGDDIGNRAHHHRVPDDIGNRLPGAAAGTGEPKKKRRRRRKKKAAPDQASMPAPEGAEAAEAAGEEAESGDEEGAADGALPEPGAEGAPAKKRKKGRPIPPLRERPAFSIGEEVFGKVAKITEHAIWIDIAGKAMGLFDRREILDEEPPQEGDQFIATVASTGVRGGMLVMSRAVPRLEESRQRIEAAAETGEYIDGFVTGVVKGGIEVDLGGLRAFAPASHVDLKHGANLEYLVGQRLEFQVTQYAKKGRDIVVSRKKLLEDQAWVQRAEALAKLQPGGVYKGIVRSVMQWGVFVALPDADDVEGLVHLTEASHDRGAKLPDLFKVGQEIEVKVLKVDDKGKLWLSRKALLEDPWAAVAEKYAVGTRHKGRVARLQPFGAFIELEPGVDGLIHTADLSLKLISHPSDVVKVNDEIDVVVVSCDSATKKIGLHPAPPPGEENEPRQKIQLHKPVNVVVHQHTEGGLVVRVLGVTGRAARAFIPSGQTGTHRGTDLRKEFPIGTRLEAKVIDVDPRRGEAKLSIRALKEDAEKQAYQQYRAGVAREAKFGTFADLMKKNLVQK